MKIGELLGKLMAFIYDEYSCSSKFRKHGESIHALAFRFRSATGNNLGSAREQLEYFRLLKNQGWIDVVDDVGRIRPTIKGIEHIEHKRNLLKRISNSAPEIAEAVGRFFKGFTGR